MRVAGDKRAQLAVAGAVGSLVILAAVLAFLADSKHRVANTNVIAPLNPAVEVAPGGRVCQRIRNLPEGAGLARIRADAASGSISPRIRIMDRAGVVSSGSVQGPQGTTDVPLSPPTRALPVATACIANRAAEPLLLHGETKRGPQGFVYRYGITFLQNDPSSLLARAGVVARRFHNGQAGALGAWTMWLALGLALGGSAVALFVVLRGEREP